MRITGLGSGLDMDQLVKESMKPYRIKIDQKGQDKEILEIKQKLYREVIKDSRELYNKYFDVTNKDSLILSKNWTTTKFTSSNENLVSVTGNSEAKVDTYTITGISAKANQITIKEGINKDDKLVINGETFTLKGESAKERANNLNNELKVKGINVSVKYTDFAATSGENKSGFVLESTILGEDNNFTIGGVFSSKIGTVTQGTDATASTITGFTIANLISAGGKIKIGDGTEIEIKTEGSTNSDIEKLLQDKLKNLKLTAEVNDSGEILFKTTELGKGVSNPKISIDKTEGTFTEGKDATFTKNEIDLKVNALSGKMISINGNLVDLTGKTTEKEISEQINKMFKEQGIAITASESSGKIVLTSNIAGAGQNIEVKVSDGTAKVASGGQTAKMIIKNSKGGIYTHTGLSNSITLDGATFKFNGDIPDDSSVTISGKQDVTETKDKLVKFINDYNKLIEKLNTLTSEKRNKNFMPLTEDQKKEMSEDEIKLWNEKVQKGQLSRDNDVTRIANSIKEAMRTLVEGSGLSLEKIGIKPVADYQGTKNGTFSIDENTLTKALEENSEEVMNLFTKAKPSDEALSNDKKYSQTGLAQRLKDILYNETVTVASSILKKAGIEGSSTVFNNEISKSIEKYEQRMKEMETDFARREQALYSKYSYLETMMNKYNSQQSYLTQQLGMG